MSSIEQILNLSYSETIRYLKENKKDMPEYINLVAQKKYCDVHNLLGVKSAKSTLNKIIDDCNESTFILIDGETATGKTTYARKVCNPLAHF